MSDKQNDTPSHINRRAFLERLGLGTGVAAAGGVIAEMLLAAKARATTPPTNAQLAAEAERDNRVRVWAQTLADKYEGCPAGSDG